MSEGLQEELRMWTEAKRQKRAYHEVADKAGRESKLLFPSERGTTFA